MIKKHIASKIPDYFKSLDTGESFQTCKLCECSLDGQDFVIEKTFKNNKVFQARELLFEYAVCMTCAKSAHQDISEESMAKIMELMSAHQSQYHMRLQLLHQNEHYDMLAWSEHCFFTGKPTRLCEEFTVSALFEKGQLIYEYSPVVVSDDFMELLQDHLSVETKKLLGGLGEELIDSPGIEDIINTPTLGVF